MTSEILTVNGETSSCFTRAEKKFVQVFYFLFCGFQKKKMQMNRL